jgi:predicted permease
MTPKWITEIRCRVRALLKRRQLDRDLREELSFHLAMRQEKYQVAGMAPEEAHIAARRRFGNLTGFKEACREMWTFAWFEDLVQDVRYGLRQLRRNPGFTAVAVITLALGIAVNTTIFSMISEVLLRKPPVRDPDRVTMVSSKNVVRGYDLQQASALDFEAWREQNHVFKDMAAGDMELPFTLTAGGGAQLLVGDRVTPNYFRVLGISPALGRTFLGSEGEPGHDHVVILSHALWVERYGGNPDVVGRSVELDGEPYTIVGIMPLGTDMPIFTPSLWTPLAFTAHDLSAPARANRNFYVFARLKPGVTVEQAQAEMASIAGRLAEAHPKTDKGWGTTVLTLQEFLIRSAHVRRGLTVLLATVGFVLLIACANIAGLLLARGAARGHEMAIRSAVGASRLRLIRQMLAESLLIGAAGGAAGLLMSVWGIHLLRYGLDFNFYVRQMNSGLYLDKTTLTFTLAVSLVTAVVFGFAPAVRVSKTNLSGALKEGGRTESGGRGGNKMRSVLVVGEIGLALLLLAGAGVMMRDLVRELTEKEGFNPNHVITAAIHLKGRNYQSPAQQVAFFDRVTERLEQLPGIESASATSDLPLAGGSGHVSFSIEGQAPLPRSKRSVTEDIVAGPAYFRTMQISLLEGRFFAPSDNTHSPVVAIANEKFARRFFPEGNAIGQRIKLDTDHPVWAEIVGIVGNVEDYMGQLSPDAQVYESYLQTPISDMSLVVRSPLAPSAVAPMLRRAVWSVDKDQPVGDAEGSVLTMSAVANENAGGDKLMTSLMGVFAALALALAAVGIYGVIAYSVNQRAHEIGIRMALGARKVDVLRLVLRQGGLLTLMGCAIGFPLALPLPRLFAAVFNGFAPQGSLAAILACLVVAVVSMLATYIPAHRASRVDPMAALRYE